MTDSKATLSATAIELEDRFQLDVYARLPITIDRGEGCYVFDSEGTRYLDLYAGHAVTSTGHCHPEVMAAIGRQASQLLFYSNATYNSTRAKALETLIRLAEPYGRAFLVNSGAEANENAIKLARALTGRKEVISAVGSFHGRTYGSLSSTGIEKYRHYLNTPVPDHTILPVESIAERISERTAAVLIEPIQSMGGVVVIPPAILREIAERCRAEGALLVFDEIQTGVGRTGEFLYARKLGLTPDLVTLAKGIASGYPAGALLVTGELAARVGKGDLGTTFGGSPLACAAILATLRVIEDEGLLAHVREVSSYLKRSLAGMESIAEVRGEGLLIGLTASGRTAREVQRRLLDRRILTGTSNDPNVLRLMPALTLGRREADLLLAALGEL